MRKLKPNDKTSTYYHFRKKNLFLELLVMLTFDTIIAYSIFRWYYVAVRLVARAYHYQQRVQRWRTRKLRRDLSRFLYRTFQKAKKTNLCFVFRFLIRTNVLCHLIYHCEPEYNAGFRKKCQGPASIPLRTGAACKRRKKYTHKLR